MKLRSAALAVAMLAGAIQVEVLGTRVERVTLKADTRRPDAVAKAAG